MRTCFVLMLPLAGVALGQIPSTPKVEPDRRFHFKDDHDGRRLADIRLRLIERDGKRSLEMTIAAVGPSVEPIPGWTGVYGANRHTAEQLEYIVSGRVLFVVKTQSDAASPWQGSWREGRRGAIPERRLGADGRIDFFAVTPREYPLELIADTDGVHEGRQMTELWFNGAPRLRVSYVVAGDAVRIVNFESLAEKTPETESPLQEAKEPAKAGDFKLPVSEDDWKSRDLEGKWMLFKKTVGDDNKKAKAFVGELARRQDFELLELIAVTPPLYDAGISAAWALAKADAPQWLRVVAVLHLQEGDHVELETKKLIMEHNPAKSLAWLDKYAGQATMTKKETENPRLERYNALFTARDLLRLNKVKPGDLGNALPPFDSFELYRHLDAPPKLADFGDRKTAEPGKVYVHQVLRALDSFAHSERFREPWFSKVHALTRHSHPKVRQAAYLAYTYFANAMPLKSQPVDEFRKVMDDAKETAVIRESALMAFASFDHPQVDVRLHEITLEVDSPLWLAAMQYLQRHGDEFTLDHYTRVDKTRLSKKNAEVLASQADALKRWLDHPQRNRQLSRGWVQWHLERVAWAEAAKSPIAKNLLTSTRAFFSDRTDNEVVEHLRKIAVEYEPVYVVPDRPEFPRRVRELAREMLKSPE